MHNNFENGYISPREECYNRKHREPPEWLVSHGSTPMTRESSGESINTFYSDMVRTPYSEYVPYGSLRQCASIPHQDALWSSAPISVQDVNFSPAGYGFPPKAENSEYAVASCDSYDTACKSNESWEFYDIDVEAGREPYWEPKVPFTSNRQYRLIEEYATVSQSLVKDGLFVCQAEGCTKNFKRKADLERHYKNLHTLSEWKDQFPCDWKKCQRAKYPFHRVDHQREHYREFHHEDIMRRGPSGKQDGEWWGSRVVNPDWWRCSRCLNRVSIAEHGYICRECKTSCERERMSYRLSLPVL